MKKFNIAFTAVWFVLFFCSLHPIPQTDLGVHEESFFESTQSWVDYQINNTVSSWCGGCTVDSATIEHNLALSDERMTQAILRNTFPFVVFLALFANIVAFCVKGPSDQLTNRVIGMRDGFIGLCVIVAHKLKRQRPTKQDEQHLYDGSM